jgi:hypothetical protein
MWLALLTSSGFNSLMSARLCDNDGDGDDDDDDGDYDDNDDGDKEAKEVAKEEAKEEAMEEDGDDGQTTPPPGMTGLRRAQTRSCSQPPPPFFLLLSFSLGCCRRLAPSPSRAHPIHVVLSLARTSQSRPSLSESVPRQRRYRRAAAVRRKYQCTARDDRFTKYWRTR